MVKADVPQYAIFDTTVAAKGVTLYIVGENSEEAMQYVLGGVDKGLEDSNTERKKHSRGTGMHTVVACLKKNGSMRKNVDEEYATY